MVLRDDIKHCWLGSCRKHPWLTPVQGSPHQPAPADMTIQYKRLVTQVSESCLTLGVVALPQFCAGRGWFGDCEHPLIHYLVG